MDISHTTRVNDRLRQERIQRNWRQKDVAEQIGTTVLTVKRWEGGQQKPSAYFRLKLCVLFEKSMEELGFLVESSQTQTVRGAEQSASVEAPSFPLSSAMSAVWSVPYPRNPFFTGREEILQQLYTLLHRKRALALTQSWAISGLGGIGKTQIALEYVYRYRHQYRFVFWTSAATHETLLVGFVAIAELLQLPEKDDRDQTRTIRAVKQWFATHQDWLLVLDNADDISMVHDFVPMDHMGYLVLTSRAQALGSLAQRIDVETIGMAEGTLFLLRRAKLLAPDGILDHVSPAVLADAEAIVIEMDFLPLAIDQAGAYIDEVGCSLSCYLDLYRTHRKALLGRRGHLPAQHPESVVMTWSLSFQKIEQARPAAADLLRLIAFLEPDAIPEELMSAGGTSPDPVLRRIVPDTFALNEALEELRKFSLVQRDPETRLLRIHHLVQVVLRDAMEANEQRYWAECAVRAASVMFPETVEMATWPACLRSLSQAQVCALWIQTYAFTFAEAASLLFRTARYLQTFALYEQAKSAYQQAAFIWEQIQGTDHPGVADSLYRLALLHHQQGKYEQAELMYHQSLKIRESALGPDHPDVATSLDGLAGIFIEQNKTGQAEPLLRRALSIWKQTRGPDHFDTSGSLLSLAMLLADQEEYEQAEPLFWQALQIREQVLDPAHPGLAEVLYNMTCFYQMQEMYERAEPLGQWALHIWEQTLGPNHIYVAFSLNTLAEIDSKQGKDEQAELFFQRAVRIREQALGPEHTHLASSLDGLANLYTKQGKYEQAEALFQRALQIREKSLDQRHIQTAEILANFAELRAAQGQYQEAVSLYQRSLTIHEQILGPAHAQTLTTQAAYAALLQSLEHRGNAISSNNA